MASISNERLNEYIRVCYETAGGIDAPVNASEAARRLDIPVSWTSWCLRYLVRREDLDMIVVDHEYKESSPLPPSWMEYAERHAWMSANFYFNPDLVELERVDEKIKSYKRASWAGLQIARKSEDYLLEACLRITKNVTKTIFNSPEPDVVMPDKEMVVEISIRYENEIDHWYINKKKELLMEKYPDYKMLIIAPKFDENIWKKYKRKIVIGEINVERFPKRFPIFMEYKDYEVDFRNFARETELISSDDYINGLEKIIRGYL